MAQDSHLFTFPAGSDVACYLVPTAHVYCTLRDSTLTSEPALRPSCPSAAATSSAPLPQTWETWSTGSHSYCKCHPQSHLHKVLLLFPGLLDRARVVRTDRQLPPSCLCTTRSPPHLVSLLYAQLTPQEPAPTRYLPSPHQEKQTQPSADTLSRY